MLILPFERHWAAAVLEGFAPPGGEGLAPAPGEVDYLGVHLRLLAATPPTARLGLRFAVMLAALSPLWLFKRGSTLAGLPPAERAAFLGRLLRMRGPVGELTTLLKLCASIALLGKSSVRERSGYDRPASHARA